MTRFIAQLEIEAEAVLPDGAPPLTYEDPRGAFKVRLINRSVRPLYEKPRLEMQLEFEADSLEAADEKVSPLARQFLYWLSFATHSGYRISAIERLIDWTPGLTMRDQYMYKADRTTMPQPLIQQELAETIALFNTKETPEEVRRALRWFANGVHADLKDDQFQAFFFAIEILAEYHKSPDRVPSNCPTCRGELFCKTCNTAPTHRPYPKQAIRQLLNALLKADGDAAFKLLDKARNSVMHGSHIDEIEDGLPMPFEDIVDRTARIAWHCILRSIPLPVGEYRPAFAQTNTFVRRTMTVKLHCQLGSWGDHDNPRLEDQGTLQMSIEPRTPQPKP